MTYKPWTVNPIQQEAERAWVLGVKLDDCPYYTEAERLLWQWVWREMEAAYRQHQQSMER
jgi:ribosome modulation factor